MVRAPALESQGCFYCVHLEKLFGSTGVHVYSPQGPETVLECSGLMIARGVIVKRF